MCLPPEPGAPSASSCLEQTYETLAPPPFTADFPGPPLASLRPIGSHWPFDLVGKKKPRRPSSQRVGSSVPGEKGDELAACQKEVPLGFEMLIDNPPYYPKVQAGH